MSYSYKAVAIPEDWKKAPALMRIDPICLEILCQRGFKTVNDVSEFLFPKFSDVVKNTRFTDIDIAIDRLIEAINKNELIVVYQDYDVDGCAACSIMVENLKRFGANVWFYGNDRQVDGYGLCKNGVDAILRKEPTTRLILTVDNGIVAYEGVEHANSKGLDVIVTDHHEPGAVLPAALAVIDPKRKDEIYPFHDLCGAGLALKIMFELCKRLRKNLNDVAMSADLAALATVADVVPMVGENRAIVKEGLKYINDGIRPMFKILNAVKGVQKITAHGTLAFKYAPMINAVSRMGYDTDVIVNMFLSNDTAYLTKNILRMDEINTERKEETAREIEIAEGMIDKANIGSSIIVYDDSFKEGIVGIVAGRLKEEHNRPVIVFAPADNGRLKASGRSVSSFNLKENLDKMSEVMLGYGGHTMAAGLSIEESRLGEFTQRFTEIADAEVDINSCQEPTRIDAVIKSSELTMDLLYNISVLEPFGEGFKEPCFGLIAEVDNVFYMGSEQQHVKWIDSKNEVSIITWHGAEAAKKQASFPTKFVGSPSMNEYRGKISMQFETRDDASA